MLPARFNSFYKTIWKCLLWKHFHIYPWAVKSLPKSSNTSKRVIGHPEKNDFLKQKKLVIFELCYEPKNKEKKCYRR